MEKPWFLEGGGISFRQWKKQKRAELKAVQKAFDKYRLGCAYCPGFEEGDVSRLSGALKNLREFHSYRNWGR